MKITRNGAVTDGEINGLREAVRWDFTSGSYNKSLRKAYAYFTARDRERLVGFVSIVSDGVNDAFLADLVVHPDYRRRNVGYNLVQSAARLVKSRKIQCLQTTFNPWNTRFYKACGFHVFRGGIMDFKTMRVNPMLRPFRRATGDRRQ